MVFFYRVELVVRYGIYSYRLGGCAGGVSYCCLLVLLGGIGVLAGTHQPAEISRKPRKTLEHIGRSRAHGEMTSMQHPATDEEQTPAPPVKIGDYVWVYDEFMWGLIPCQVDRPYHCRCGEDGGCTFETFFADSDFGKTVFLTREEAEKALAERSEG